MTIEMMLLQGLALVGLICLPYAIYLTWKTTDKIFFTLLMTLICFMCGLVTLIGVYDFITFIK